MLCLGIVAVGISPEPVDAVVGQVLPDRIERLGNGDRVGLSGEVGRRRGRTALGPSRQDVTAPGDLRVRVVRRSGRFVLRREVHGVAVQDVLGVPSRASVGIEDDPLRPDGIRAEGG